MRVFVDTSVLLLAAGIDHPLRSDCVGFLQRCQRDLVEVHCSIEAVQEFSFHRLRRVGRQQALRETEALVRAVVTHPFDDEVLARALQLMAGSTIRGRDAVHAATALRAGFDLIVSTDPDFDEVPGIRRLAPGDA